LKGEKARADLASFEADLVVVAAYGLILPQAILDVPRLGGINLHGSCLPRWRGAAPIQRAILAGDASSGVTIIRMEAGLDTGPILAMEEVAIDQATTAQSLHDELADLAARMVVPMVDRLAAGEVRARAQPDQGAVYAPKIEKSEGRIDWRQPAVQIDRQIRALNPWPGCWTDGLGQRLLVLSGMPVQGASPGQAEPGSVLDDALSIACGEGVYRITRLQRAGGKPMTTSDFLRGLPVSRGIRLGASCPATS
jgi:methionyl-tRNA formyltransferase